MSHRLISFDTETTGLDFSTGDRVIEIGCVEIIGREKSGKEFQTYINPEGKEISKGQRIGHRRKTKKQQENENKPGNEPGEEMYEIEMSLEELAGYLFSDLELPELEKRISSLQLKKK